MKKTSNTFFSNVIIFFNFLTIFNSYHNMIYFYVFIVVSFQLKASFSKFLYLIICVDASHSYLLYEMKNRVF